LTCRGQSSFAAPKVWLSSLRFEERPCFRELRVRLRLAPRAGSVLGCMQARDRLGALRADWLIDRGSGREVSLRNRDACLEPRRRRHALGRLEVLTLAAEVEQEPR